MQCSHTEAAALEAAWVLTNIAAAHHDAAAAVMAAAPAFIAHLSGQPGCQLARQCAWAIGRQLPARSLSHVCEEPLHVFEQVRPVCGYVA